MRTRVTAALIAVLALATWLAAPALAASPLRLTSEITGQSGTPSLNAGVTHRSGTTPAAEPGSGFSGGAELAVIIGGAVLLLAIAVLLLAIAVLLGRRMSRARARGPAGRAGPGGPAGRGGGPGGPSAGPPPAELEAQASHALVETDDAIRTSQQELGFATARFGERAAAPFSAALKSAGIELAAAFKLRQLLDDDIPESEPVRRQYLTEISAHCGEANRLLDEQSEAFDRFQDLEARAPGLAAEVLAHTAQQSERIEIARQLISRLAAKYTPQAVGAVAGNPDQATERLQFAAGRLADAQQAMAADQAGQAAVSLQAAESSADQASDLLDGVKHLDAELTQAASALPAALREIDADIAEGAALLASRPADGRASLVASARAVADEVRSGLAAGPCDVLAALRSLEQADAALDQALASAREDRARQERARALLDQTMLVARSSMTAAEDFITTRRGGVGARARTRLAEAQRHFQQAIAFAQADPEAAVSEAQHADALAREARALAERDVGQFDYGQPSPARARTGGFGGGVGAAILGGILIDSLLGGGRAGLSRGGGLGGGGFGPGSFGGTGTRGRRSIAGRF